MALLAEEIVEEWLNRQGYFTIRGIKLGVHEIDLLALRIHEGNIECRHVEVTASIRPMSYITDVPKAIRKATGRPPKSPTHRATEELQVGIKEWVDKKYNLPRKAKLREQLHPGHWSFELVVHKVVHPEELELLAEAGIKIHHLEDIVNELENKRMMIASASGTSLVDLILLDIGNSKGRGG
ncbi:MAG: hypothetical protein ACTSQ8_21400 [Candidatus Helarchaeota archaeon]